MSCGRETPTQTHFTGTTMSIFRRLPALLLAVIVTAASGSLVQTQFNIAALTRLQVEVDLQQRLAMTAGDLLHFAPLFSLLLVLAFLPAFLVTGLLIRWLNGRPTWLYALAGGIAVLTALLLMNALLPMTPLQMTTEISGLLALTLSGVLGGWVFALTGNALVPRH